MVYIAGVVSIIMFGIACVIANVINASAVDTGSRGLDLWAKTTSFMQALAIIGLLVWFAIETI